MNVFVTGATGYIGTAVADKLQQAGHQVVGLARSEESAEKLQHHGHEVQHGSLTDAEALAEAADAAEGVIHVASTGGPDQSAVDLQAVRVLLDALEGTGKPFVYTDGVWVLGDTGDNVADEDVPVHPIELVAWRPMVVDRVIAADLRSVVIRPAIVYGRAGGIPAMLVGWGRERGAVPYIADGTQRWPFVHVDDLADLYVRALEDGPPGTLLQAADGPSYEMREVAEAASHAAGVPGKTQRWPLNDARETLGPFADALALDQQVSSERARTLLDWKPQAPPVLEDLRQGSYAG